jgi:hypothetical protein
MRCEAIASAILWDDMRFVWVQSHWTSTLTGFAGFSATCAGSRLKTMIVNRRPAASRPSTRERQRWLYRKKKFEVCVGYHCTYPGCGTIGFRRRKTRWLGALLWWWQYGDLKAALRCYLPEPILC